MYKYTIILLISLTLNFVLFSQTKFNVNFKIKADTLCIPKYDIDKINKENQIVFKMRFGESEIKNPKEARQLKGGIIEKVELVYTNFPEGADLDLLNKRRLIELYLLCPEAFRNPMTQWKLIAQNNCKTNWEASRLFHGIVITYRSAPSARSAKNESDYLSSVMNGKTILVDSTIFRVFRRNSGWKNMLIVSDFTGSMSPYIAQVLVWHSLNIQKKAVMNFVFFNDGDSTIDSKKEIGKTGGLYGCTANNTDTVFNTAVKTITNGFGGDTPENDIEAILYGLKKYPDCNEIILIADNWSNMRDYSLISKIKKPVRIILCGAKEIVTAQYLDLAYQTKGSIHTIEDDLEELYKVNEGKIIKIGQNRIS